MHNYFLNLSNSFSECTTQEQLDAKTQKIAQVFASFNADVYAMCELEVSDTVVGYITAALNQQLGSAQYAYIHDGLEASETDGATKVGFIYKVATVTPLSNKSTSSSGTDRSTYGRRMRWIGFKENSTGEKFIVSMNHFKAKVSGEDQGNAQRVTNATNLYNAMTTMQRTDPDILVLGDMNCTTDEEPIQYLISTAGLTEQLERFNSSAYSYYYNRQYQLIDHAMANATCAQQIVGAGLSHIATGGYSLCKFSDHDLYMVGLNLGSYTPIPEDTTETPAVDPVTVLDAKLTDGMYNFSFVDGEVDGFQIWTQSKYGMIANGYDNGTRHEADAWLMSPAVALPDSHTINLTFDHTYQYTQQADQDLTLYVSTDYTGDRAAATWEQLTIPTYPAGNNWTFVSSGDIDLSDYAGETITLGWRYQSATDRAAKWEIKNVKIVATPNQTTGVESQKSNVESEKLLLNGQLYILRGDVLYDITGRVVR